MTDIQNQAAPNSSKNPWVAFFLTFLFPGLGHLYLGNRWSAMAYGAIAMGIWVSYYSAQSFMTKLAVIFIFPFVMIPASRDAVAIAQGKKKAVTGDESRIYVVWMLCCVGPFAIPLLWQNKRFSIQAKIVWTCIVLLVVFLFLSVITTLGKSYDEVMQKITG